MMALGKTPKAKVLNGICGTAAVDLVISKLAATFSNAAG